MEDKPIRASVSVDRKVGEDVREAADLCRVTTKQFVEHACRKLLAELEPQLREQRRLKIELTTIDINGQ